MSTENDLNRAFFHFYSLFHFLHPINTVAILMYHNVSDDAPPSYRSIRSKDFQAQMGFLKKYCEVLSIQDLVGIYPSPSPEIKTKKPRVLITIDDGFRDSYTHAFPILKSLGLPATIFVISNKIDWDLTQEDASRREFLNLREMKEMHEYGIKFCSHTRSHPYLTRLAHDQQKWQIQEGVDKLYSHFPDAEVREVFAYPYGEYNEVTLDVLKELGFKVALTAWHQLNGTWDHPLKLKRLTADGRDDIVKFACQLNPYLFKLYQSPKQHELKKDLLTQTVRSMVSVR